MNNFNPLQMKEILVIRVGKIGDVILSSFVFTALKKYIPGCRIELITLKKNKDVLNFNPHLDKIYHIRKNILSYFKMLPLGLRKFDLVIDLNDNPSTTSSILLKLIQSKQKLGFEFEKQKKYLTISVKQPVKEKSHIIERYSELLQAIRLPITSDDLQAELYLNENILQSISQQLDELKRHHKLIGINLSAGSEIRKYPAEKWIELLNVLSQKFRYLKFLILFDSGDINSAMKIINSSIGNLIINIEGKTFQHFAAKIKNLDLLITPDTSAVHIASAFKIPVLALYPSVKWNFVSFAPYKTKFRAIQSNLEEIKFIEPSEIIKSFEELINELNWRYE